MLNSTDAITPPHPPLASASLDAAGRRTMLKAAAAAGLGLLLGGLAAEWPKPVLAAMVGRIILFSGRTWLVKAYPSPLGPGPNHFSDSADNVWVDGAGRLHLRITASQGRWHCAEVICTETLGYGVYRFLLDSPVDALDPNVVLGLFTWHDDPQHHHRELDIEFTRWGYPTIETAQYSLQPYALAGNQLRFWQPAGLAPSTHSITWNRGAARFQSARGLAPALLPPGDTRIISDWAVTDVAAVPPAGGENVRMNLWLNQGLPPTDGREVEVVIRAFEFEPPGHL